jgi:[protein-PII] uridylyltransferase
MQSLEQIKKFYKASWDKIKHNRFSYNTSWQLSQRLTELADSIVIKACKHSGEPSDIAVVALGGYAREQMAPYSDIDILILHKTKITKSQEEFINQFTTAMWDIGTNPGIQIKFLKDVAKAALEDEVVKTSFIDNRFLFGSKSVYESFIKIINDKVMERGKSEFLMMKIDAVRNRNAKYRDSIYRLQPNIKEGNGGLRDINTIYWICKILYKTRSLHETVKHNILTHDEYEDLIDNSEFLFRVRNELHYFHDRKYDVMNLEAQMEIATALGYMATSSVQSVEIFMRDYYMRAKKTAEITQKVINRTLNEISRRKFKSKIYRAKLADGFVQYANTITVDNASIFDENPKKLITIFSHMASRGLILSDSVCDLIRSKLYIVDSSFMKDYGKFFLRTISMFPNSGKLVSSMAKCGLLQAMIPEFEYLECRPQFDYYHHYTVDEHTLLALSYIDKLLGNLPPHLETYRKALTKIKRKDLLTLSILLHDIGKGQGKNHSIVGAKMSRIICKRLGLSMDDTDTVCAMVEHHLLMSHIAQRRDLHSIEVIDHFCSYLNSTEELNILFLLTYADMNAVGGASFNEWKNSLLKELYSSSEMAITTADLEIEFQKVVSRRKVKLAERCKNMPEIYEMVKTLDEEYIYSNKAVHIIRYLNMAHNITKENDIIVELDIREELDTIEVVVCARDHVGLLRKICGALASLGYNIKWAQIYTLENDITIDNILIGNPYAGSKFPEIKQEAIKKRIIDTIKDEVDVEKLIDQSSNSILAPNKTIFSKKDKILFDNEISSQYTVVDIFAQDELGLLYYVLGTFNKLGLSVEKAKISTDVDRVVDSFYLTDMEGGKIVDQKSLDKIRRELFKEIESQIV